MNGNERKGEAEKEKQKREKNENESVSGRAHFVSHPFAGLFELFAFWDVLFCVLHIILSLQHPPLNVVHQSTLHTNKS